ncbi:MAG: PP2C family protein-serine/threonine phosphatase [Hyphomicrobiaceae bacterium]
MSLALSHPVPVIDRYAHASEAIIGARDHQEDYCLFAFADGGPGNERTGETGAGELVAVLADGMGGHVAGELASQTACTSFAEAYCSARVAPADRLSGALKTCNEALAKAISQDETLDGMGCTLIGAAFGERGMRWVSVGDSHLYLFRDRKLYLLNEDHSMAPVIDEMASKGLLGNEEARNHPRRHLLRSALTGTKIEMIDIGSKLLKLETGDCIIMATDGIEAISNDAIAAILADRERADPAEIVAALVDAIENVNDPLQDNTTVMAIQPKFA